MSSSDVSRMTVRRPPFAHRRETALHWNAAKPEFSHVVNAASLAMPYLEPYLIKTMREARALVRDENLVRDLDLYCAQESAHYRQHRKFNDELKALRPETVGALEAVLDADYKWLGRERSLKFNLAYAEGFESMALALGHMLVEEREFLFGGAEPSVASLVLWHFVEEVEHKNVTFDVFKHIHDSYVWRIAGLFYATFHIMRRTRSGYQALLKKDGLWHDMRSRLALAHALFRIFASLTPKFLRILRPSYHPSEVADPAWMLAWAKLYEASDAGAARLDTARLREPFPISLPA
ncbi:MAG: metal-dependent hydrolase [Parvibaculum sp.]|uniref:metal-dependent hydrolase n=1 Tax=Parvibaculum sp. TaxID=2024848 RepID=UPI0025D45895|nr:metal-dependent hydrolase [Parvibaculum sp.]MCE9650921.1 metal-dependent hydrolase [Parvibaculum sp.]